MTPLPLFASARWLELALDYRCNLRCLGCRACQGGDEALAPARALARLRQARASGVDGLWLGGGEPTLRRAAGPAPHHPNPSGFPKC